MGKQHNRVGWLYVLFDAHAELCKIGRTTQPNNKRQAGLIAGHCHPLVNLINARVEDCHAAERQCHSHFSRHRRNGEWFAVPPDEVAAYVNEQVDWLEIDLAPLAKVGKAMVDARQTPKTHSPRRLVHSSSTHTEPRVETIDGVQHAFIENVTINLDYDRPLNL